MTMHPDCERIMLTEEQLRQRVKEVALEVDKAYEGKRPLVVGILKGSIIFYSDFIRFLTMPVELDFMAVSSYGSGAVSSGKLKIKKDLDGAASVKIVTLLNKAERREYDVAPDYNCFDIENEFVVGYGLDYNEQYRHLPYIGILKRSVYEK